MKKLPIVGLLVMLMSETVSAQIPNSSFEDSTYAKYRSTLKFWNCPNEVYKNFAVSGTPLEVNNNSNGTDAINLISDESTLSFEEARRFPINGRPDSLVLWFDSYDLNTDTLLIRTKNRETGNDFGYGETKITGAYFNPIPQRVAINISYTSPGFADSGVIQMIVLKGPIANSEHNIDILKVEFVNFIGQPLNVIPNKSFNEWNEDSIVSPLGWTTQTFSNLLDGLELNSPLEYFSSDASNGSLAMVLETKEAEGDILPGLLGAINPETSNTYSGDIDNPKPMFPVAKKYASLLGDYKFTNAGQDTAQVMIAMFNQGQEIGIKRLNIIESTGSAYESFEAHISYSNPTSMPDSAAIFITNGINQTGTLGTQLFIDNLRFAETSTAQKLNSNQLGVYPNPAHKFIRIDLKGENIESIKIMDLQGRILKYIQRNNIKTVDISSLPTGTYIITAMNGGKVYNQKLTKTN